MPALPTPPAGSHVKTEPVVATPLVSAPSRGASPSRTSAQPMLYPKPEPSIDSASMPDKKPDKDDLDDSSQTNYLQQIVALNNPETLEAGVKVGVQVLDGLLSTLTSDNDDIKAWVKSIKDLRERAKPAKTIVGVVGNTGAGKSSVINALLDEERLLPTNCMRACTASPTEISYNYSVNPDELYRAEIEFISKQDWIRELGVLFKDLLDGNGEVSRDCNNSDSDAGVAYAKLTAVYPNKTKEMLATGTPERFAADGAVSRVLGTTKKLTETTSKDLFRRMQHYVDSKEKERGDRNRKDQPMEYWPLIKVVRIYTKATALSTGAVIVDLPGVQDSNAARAAVAANYMKACTGLWIVAPINRAVDDKTAKTLLGDSFKRQLKFDGTYSAVTFICSKTDDISVLEASESLGIDEEISESYERSEDLKRTKERLKKKVVDLRAKKRGYNETIEDIETKWDIWDDLRTKASEGETVYAPAEKSNNKKRKRQNTSSKSRKNHASSDTDDSEDSVSDWSDKENSQPTEEQTPLTEQEIEQTLAALKSQKKQIREDKRELDVEIKQITQQMEECQQERDTLLGEMRAICVQGRNEYSRGAIKQDFASGIKELDQENAVEEDEATFDPDQDLRDYDEVARTLPVFCVSSRAYQSLSGRFQKDDIKASELGFPEAKDTEIPQLQQHAKKLTEAGRASTCRRFLNDFSQLTNSLKLWASTDGTQSHLTDAEKRREDVFLRKLLQSLEDAFEKTVKESMASVHQSLNEHIIETFNTAIPKAVRDAINTASGWGAHRSMGGLFWSTYKATVRRQGVYSGASGPRDFNQELFDPISKDLATGWERAFQRRVPLILDQFASSAKAQLSKFHQSAVERAQQRHTNVAGVMMLSQQILNHIRTLGELPATLKATITDLQREASRQFVPVIMEAMAYAYHVCSEERGTGSYARMKTAMIGHVELNKNTMFVQACNTVKTHLDAMCRTVQREMNEHVENIFDMVYRDYNTVLIGTTVGRPAKITPEERAIRSQVNSSLKKADTLFCAPLGIHVDAVMDDADNHAHGDSLNDAMEDMEQAMVHENRSRQETPLAPVSDDAEDSDDPFASPVRFKTELGEAAGIEVSEEIEHHVEAPVKSETSSDDERDAASQLQFEALQAGRVSETPAARVQSTDGSATPRKLAKPKKKKTSNDFQDIFDILGDD
ncbi:hypothetical protein PFICI_00655 [Pestalotiopsis fici W106-1]|uniref:G domain-containing protein n=1 Tax=Pestalotiopsis fici (strain W106-1 / CGMCC3.15140) TaxID=1229662 RepID=W3XMU2_PESFW|nr:uncharacterized protein PFICI_00655 [Pestalotiopsis fici W106-1]ETS86827.1 hypothetical protein PFICI_00655 [Pestalotiopsis fici W106-1]